MGTIPETLHNQRQTGRTLLYLHPLSDNTYYVGYTRELRLRMIYHKDGNVISTQNKDPQLIYFETLPTEPAAKEREKQPV